MTEIRERQTPLEAPKGGQPVQGTQKTDETKGPAGGRAPTSNALETKAADEGAVRPLRKNADKISCPFLATAFNMGDLNPKEDGTIETEQLMQLMAKVSFDHGSSETFVKAADDTSPIPKSFNLFDMRHNKLNHKGSTGIRDMSIRPELMPKLLSFGENGRMYRESFAAAANHFYDNPNGMGSQLGGAFTESIEFSSVLEVFHRTDKAGRKYLTNEDCIGLWLKNVYPAGWTPREPNSITMPNLMGNTAKTGFARIVDAVLRFLRLKS